MSENGGRKEISDTFSIQARERRKENKREENERGSSRRTIGLKPSEKREAAPRLQLSGDRV